METSELPRERRRHLHKGPANTGIVYDFHKLMGLLDGSGAHVASALERAFDAVYVGKESVVVIYSQSSHKVERVLDGDAILDRFLEWKKNAVDVDLQHIQPLAESMIEYTISITNENKTTVSICTATLMNGKIFSTVEKIVKGEEEEEVEREENGGSKHDGMLAKEDEKPVEEEKLIDGHSAVPFFYFCKGTSLEVLEHSGGFVFMNAHSLTDKVTKVTAVTQQDKGQGGDLELVECKPESRYNVKNPKKNKAHTNSTARPWFYLRETGNDQMSIVLCRREHMSCYYIDGLIPLYHNELPVYTHEGVDFYPRYKMDDDTQCIQIWNGSSYANYTDIAKNKHAANSKSKSPRLSLAMGELLAGQQQQSTASPECVAQISTRDLLRAKIKIPMGGDPSLMICLTKISDYQRQNSTSSSNLGTPFQARKQFATVHVPVLNRPHSPTQLSELHDK